MSGNESPSKSTLLVSVWSVAPRIIISNVIFYHRGNPQQQIMLIFTKVISPDNSTACTRQSDVA